MNFRKRPLHFALMLFAAGNAGALARIGWSGGLLVLAAAYLLLEFALDVDR